MTNQAINFMTTFIKAFSKDKFLNVFFEGVKDFVSLDNDLVSDEVQEIMKNENNRKVFLEKIEDLRLNEETTEVIIEMETGSVTVRSK